MGKHSVQITDDNFYNELCEYCKINGLKISSFVTDLLKKQFLIEQYGDTPFTTYETTIIDNSPVSSLTVDVSIEKPNEDESVEIDAVIISPEVAGVNHSQIRLRLFPLLHMLHENRFRRFFFAQKSGQLLVV